MKDAVNESKKWSFKHEIATIKTESAIWKFTKLHFDGGFKICVQKL